MSDLRAATGSRFCPACGAEALEVYQGKAVRCRECDYLFFHNAAAAAAAILVHRGLVVLTRRARPPRAGCWDLPGGFVDPGEGLEQALRRELHEELGLVVDELRYLCALPNTYEYAGVRYRSCDAFFVAAVGDVAGLVPADDVSDWRLASPAELPTIDLAFVNSAEALARWRCAVHDGGVRGERWDGVL